MEQHSNILIFLFHATNGLQQHSCDTLGGYRFTHTSPVGRSGADYNQDKHVPNFIFLLTKNTQAKLCARVLVLIYKRAVLLVGWLVCSQYNSSSFSIFNLKF